MEYFWPAVAIAGAFFTAIVSAIVVNSHKRFESETAFARDVATEAHRRADSAIEGLARVEERVKCVEDRMDRKD